MEEIQAIPGVTSVFPTFDVGIIPNVIAGEPGRIAESYSSFMVFFDGTKPKKDIFEETLKRASYANVQKYDP